ncbi:MAG: hypothetical protein RTU92_13980 [Candidatus Thorarchaeota archaeon]
MSPRKTVFKEPIVRVKMEGVRFPSTCPVCGAPTTTTTRMTTYPNRKIWLRPGWDPAFTPNARRRLGIANSASSTFRIPVCEDHIVSDQSDCRYRTLCTIGNGLIFAFALFALLTTGSDIWLGRRLSLWAPFVVVLVVFTLIVNYFAFRPRPLEAALKIVGFDHGVQYVWLAIKDSHYRETFLDENQMHAELVRWIIKA